MGEVRKLNIENLPKPQSAYDIAKADGYLGTEEQYAKDMAAEPVSQEKFDAIPGRISKIVGSSEASDFVHIADSAADTIVDFGLEGKTEQKSTSGKNLWSFESGYESTGQGFLVPVGTVFNISAGTYTLSFNASASGVSFDMAFYDANKAAICSCSNVVVSGKNTNIFTLSRDAVEIRLYVTGGAIKLSDIQLELGSTATDYEPFTNGPTPNPEYPQEIVNAGRKSKNLFDISKVLTNEEYVINNGDSLTINATAGNAGVNSCSPNTLKDYAPNLIIGETYTFSCKFTGTSSWVIYCGGGLKNGQSFILTEEIYNSTITWYASGSDTSAVISNIQIELGSTATDYEPYGYKIGCRVGNKNLWDAEYASDFHNWNSGSVYGTQYPSIPIKVISGVPITISYNKLDVGITGLYVTVAKGDNEGNYAWLYHASVSKHVNNRVTITPIKDVIYITVAAANEDLGYVDNFMQYIGNDLQIEIADATTDYTPHQSQPFTLTSPVPITKWDKLVKRDGVWGWSVWSFIKTFDGSDDEQWFKYVNNVNKVPAFRIESGVNLKLTGTHMCSHFVVKINGWNQGTHGNFGCNAGGSMYFVTEEVDNVNDWKTWLQSHIITVVANTSEEQSFHPLPESEQTLLNNLETYYGVTNLYNDQGCPMWLTYVQDTKTYVDNKFNNIKTALLSLGANV